MRQEMRAGSVCAWGRVAPIRAVALTLLIMFAAAHADRAWGQGGSAVADPPEAVEETALTTTAQTVDVAALTSDEAIEARLRRILDATERFRSPGVEVRDGVAFLTGRTDDAANRDWAGELARKTEDVVAVVNNIEVESGPIWTVRPALREIRTLWQQFIQAAPLLLVGLAVFVGTLLLARILVRIADRQLGRRVQSDLVRNVIGKLLFVAIALVGVYLFLRITGLTRIAVTLAGGTGLVGLVVGFAFRDIAENFLASVLISVQRPFRLGDTIEVDGHTGVVQKVTTRGTVLMDFDGNHIQIANATVYKNTIRNLTANPKVRAGFSVGVGYDASISDAQGIAMDVLQKHSAVLDTPEPVVLVEQLGAATIVLRMWFWIDGHEHSLLKVRSSLMRLIVRAYEEAGISLPDEAREVIFPQAVPVRMLPEPDAGVAATPAPPTPAASTEDDDEVTEAEGDLRSEVADIQQQAKESRTPEEGDDIMQSEAEEAGRADGA
ncbi:MAG: mechanosensitive ion channel [Phycisphaerales bacterium]|nr:mechanosensitive ion channel [Phycisphaerales bacterium]